MQVQVNNKIINAVFSSLKGLGRLFPPWFTNPGLIGTIGRNMRVGLKNTDPDTAYDLLILPADKAPVLIDKAMLRGARIVNLQLSPAFFLETKHSFPKKAAAEIEAALALHIRQNTPFSAQDIIWRYTICKKDKTTLTASLFIIKKEVLDAICDTFASSGLKVRSAQHEVNQLVILDQTSQIFPAQRFWRRLAQASFFLAIILASAASYFNYQHRVERLGQISHETALLQDQAIALQDAAAAQQGEAMQIASFLTALNHDRQILAIIGNLTTLLPDTTWLAQLSLRRKDIRFAGFSTEDPSNLVIIIEASPDFSHVLLSGPVTRDSRLGQNRFEMALALETNDE